MCPVAVKKAISQLKGVKWVKAYLDIIEAISRTGNYKGRILDEKEVD